MLEKTYKSYELTPTVYPYAGTPKKRPKLLVVKVPKTFTGIDFSKDYCSHLYPSSKWQTEKQEVYANKLSEVSRGKHDFVITSLDTRKHNPQTTNLFHIKRINTKPVCGVEAWSNSTKPPVDGDHHVSSVYKVSFKDDVVRNSTQRLVHKQTNPKPAEAIVPVDLTGNKFDVRTEMMLPICDSTVMPSAHNPHQYLLRKRKVPPPFKSSWTVYPNLEKPRMTSYSNGEIPTGDLPFETQRQQASDYHDDPADRTSISTLSGMSFTRRKYIQPPSGHIFGSMDAGLQHRNNTRFDDRNLPYIRAKTII